MKSKFKRNVWLKADDLQTLSAGQAEACQR